MKQVETIEDGADLHGDRRAVDGAVPYRLAWLPSRREQYHRPRRRPLLGLADEPHADATGFTPYHEVDFGTAEPHRTPRLAHHRASGHLAGNATLALAEHVVNRGRDRRDGLGGCARRRL